MENLLESSKSAATPVATIAATTTATPVANLAAIIVEVLATPVAALQLSPS